MTALQHNSDRIGWDTSATTTPILSFASYKESFLLNLPIYNNNSQDTLPNLLCQEAKEYFFKIFAVFFAEAGKITYASHKAGKPVYRHGNAFLAFGSRALASDRKVTCKIVEPLRGILSAWAEKSAHPTNCFRGSWFVDSG
jgi:hypothetical protein